MKTYKRKGLSLFLCLLLLISFTSCGRNNVNNPEEAQNAAATVKESGTTETASAAAVSADLSSEFRGFWLSFSEIKNIFTDDENAFYSRLYNDFSFLKSKGFNAVIFHARAFSDAFYRSELFPWSKYLTGTEGAAPSFDPLASAITAAHNAGLSFHAWINPYRVSYNNDIKALSERNPARVMFENGGTRNLLITDGGIYYNPASVSAQKLIIDGVREIVQKYDVDGIHIDDYFYPSDTGDTDSEDYDNYVLAGGALSLSEWRLANVSSFVSGMYSAVKSVANDISVGISPSGIKSYNYETCFADVEKWASESGYCDYIVPQIYFGFLNNYAYEEMLDYWSDTCSENVKLYIGLALYKTGEYDSYAGSEAAGNEWLENKNIISRQIISLRKKKNCAGFVIFSYGDLFDSSNEIRKSETAGIYNVMSGG